MFPCLRFEDGVILRIDEKRFTKEKKRMLLPEEAIDAASAKSTGVNYTKI